MKSLALLLAVVWLVKWAEFQAVKSDYTYNGFSPNGPTCSLDEVPEKREFPTKSEALKFIEDNKGDRKKWDFRLYKITEE